MVLGCLWAALEVACIVALIRLWGSPFGWLFWTLLAVFLLDWLFTAAARESAKMGDEAQGYGPRGWITRLIAGATTLLRLVVLALTAWAFYLL